MKKNINIIAAALLFAFVSIAGLAEAKTTEIGVVNLGFILQNSDKGKKAKKFIEAEAKKEQTIIQNKEKELRSMVEDINSKSFLLDADLKRAKAEEAQERKKELERYFQDSREKIQRKQNEMTAKILKEIVETVKKYGEKNGYTAILEQEGGSLYYFNKSIDLTQKILDVYNKK